MTEPTDAFRNPKDNESRFDFRGVAATVAVARACRGTREDGELRIDWRCEAVLGLGMDLSPFSITPNSLNDDSGGVGEGSVEPGTRPPTLRLARRSLAIFFMVGEPTAEVRLEMRGILVGVSFMVLGREFNNDGGGMSLSSLEATEFTDPMDGEPAIVGSCCPLVRNDGSDCFCIELAVWAVNLDELGEV